jgi:transglutaminase-like putative cysteine protease
MKTLRLFNLWLAVIWLSVGRSLADETAEQARNFEVDGRFTKAAIVLRAAIADTNTSAGQRKQLEFELDRLDRIRLDYPLTRAALLARIKTSVRDLANEEFEKWLAEKRFDVRVIDGEERFMVSSVANLFWRYPELNPRRLSPKDESFQKAMWENGVTIKQAAAREHSPYVLPKTFDVTMTIAVDAGAVPNGETIRAWLPVPRKYAYQDGFGLISSSSAVRQLAPESSPARSVYLEQPAASNAPTVFKINYRYQTHGVCFDVQPEKVMAFDGRDAGVALFTREESHVQFTAEIRALSQKILGDEKNPARQAKKIYEWIGTNIQYSFATEYSTIPNISEYCRSHGYGDCGQEALLFITLCRLNGIPARWQSGWDTFPGAKTIHDWTEIYLAPYGWVPVDPYMSIFSTQYATRLTAQQRRELRDFYFGGRSQWRLAANAAHCQELQPPKQAFRSDNVDFQRGELEVQGRNIYFNHFHYDLEVQELAAP